ncbi:ABC transporter permease [Ruegeria lacuscaerulensis]|uniref:ABC transporter permease n=1 Tax=Ruegeria lacuscaerulensis TaxID=55218 RepID=UPI00147E4940|nr:ABC transporter permease [Ruegeria lacuscaerulensis]
MPGRPCAGLQRILRRELRQIARYPAWIVMLVPAPIALLVVLSLIFSDGLPTDLPVAVVDLDRTTLSRQAIRMVDATSDVDVALQASSLAIGKEALVAGDVYAVVYLPENMQRDLLSGRQPEAITFYNNQYLTVGSIVARATTSALQTFSAGVSQSALISSGVLPEAAREALVPISVQTAPLFNPALDYVQFLLAALMPATLQVFMIASAAMAVARDMRVRSGSSRLVTLGRTPFGVLAGKLVPYAVFSLFSLIVADAIIFGFFGAPFRGSIPVHMCYTVLFVLSCQCFGAVVGTLAGEAVGALGLSGVLAAPAFGFAGVSIPRLTMNTFAWSWGSLLPLVPYLQLRTDQVSRGVSPEVSLSGFAWLTAQVLIYGSLAALLLWRKSRPRAFGQEGLA